MNINIVVNIDNNYIEKFFVTIESILINTQNKLNLHILIYKELNEEAISRYFKNENKINSIKFYYVHSFLTDEMIFHFKNALSKNLTISTYMRLFIPEIIKTEKKILYLDCDLIFLDDIKKLYFINMEKKSIAVVKDLFSFAIKFTSLKKKYPYYKKLKMKNYFNTGVFLLNLEKIEQDNIYHKSLIELISKYKNFFLHDQDILNILFSNDAFFLPRNWNWNLGLNYFARWNFLIKTKVIHFQGKRKPWDKNPTKFIIHWGFYRYLKWKKILKIVNEKRKFN